jgi:hypothetical protein
MVPCSSLSVRGFAARTVTLNGDPQTVVELPAAGESTCATGSALVQAAATVTGNVAITYRFPDGT